MKRKVAEWVPIAWDAKLECGHEALDEIRRDDREHIEEQGGIYCHYCAPKPTIDDEIARLERLLSEAKARKARESGATRP